MALDNPQEMKQFIILRGKDLSELQAMCEGVGVSTEGTKEELIRKLTQLGDNPPQQDVVLPQFIALRTNNDNGTRNDLAYKLVRSWRKQIYETAGNRRKFTAATTTGAVYTTTMRYIPCSERAFKLIMGGKWYHPESTQKDIIALLQKDPSAFEINLVQRMAENRGSYVMLHIQPKKDSNAILPSEDLQSGQQYDQEAYPGEEREL